MKLRVLGNPGRYLAPLSGGSGYLVEGDGGERILLDCGGGVRASLAALGVDRVDALVLSHFHHDHALDLVTILDALDERTKTFLPAGERKRLDAMAQAFAFSGPFETRGPIEEGPRSARVGGLELTFAPTQHSAPSMATRIAKPGEPGLVYASDTAPCPGLAGIVRPGDTLLMHTLLPDLPPGEAHHLVHSTAAAAALVARETQAGALWLSHRYHGIEAAEHVRAAGAFPDVRLLSTGETLNLPAVPRTRR